MVDVIVRAPFPALRMPARSMGDGTPEGEVVGLNVFSLTFRRTLARLTVDQALKARLNRFRLVRRLAVTALLIVVIFVPLTFIFALTGHLIPFAVMSAFVAVSASPLGIFLMLFAVKLQPSTFPTLVAGGQVLIRAVDEAAAQEWIDLNPGGTLEIVR
jgi:hypothetical protein